MQQGWTKEQMADEVIALFAPGASLNLGIGMPTTIAERIPAGLEIFIHSENGVLGVKGRPSKATVSATRINAGKETISVSKGASYFDSALSFGMIRGGHIDFCVLGAMQVDVAGSLANWAIPGKKITGMGGAMDLVHGARTTIAMLSHLTKEGDAKLLELCSFPLTGTGVLQMIVTDFGLFEPTGKTFRIRKLAPNIKRSDLRIADRLLES